jgi:hypothetical protein
VSPAPFTIKVTKAPLRLKVIRMCGKSVLRMEGIFIRVKMKVPVCLGGLFKIKVPSYE